MHFADDNFGVLTREDFIKETRGSFFGKGTVFTAFHVETFDFELVDIFAVHLEHIDGGIFLFGVEEESSEDVVDVNLQEPVPLINGAFEIVPDFQSFLDVVSVRIDHDGVCVPVDNS